MNRLFFSSISATHLPAMVAYSDIGILHWLVFVPHHFSARFALRLLMR